MIENVEIVRERKKKTTREKQKRQGNKASETKDVNTETLR